MPEGFWWFWIGAGTTALAWTGGRLIGLLANFALDWLRERHWSYWLAEAEKTKQREEELRAEMHKYHEALSKLAGPNLRDR